MSQPLDRNALHMRRGSVDLLAGELWVENPFSLPIMEENFSAFERNRVFLNFGDLEFMEASFASGVDLDSDSRSAIPADFDRDGAPDLLIGSVGGGPLRLFLNRAAGANHRVRIDLVGTRGNRRALGARVELRCGAERIVRDVFAVSGYMGQAPPELVVGLGAAERIDRLTIRWPNGTVQEFDDLPVDRRITLTQGEETPQISDL